MAKITALSFVIPVRDLEKAVRFYCDAFELEEVFRGENIVFAGLPGTDSAVGLLLNPDSAGSGPQHIGFHMSHGLNHDHAVADVERAGAKIIERGEHAPGSRSPASPTPTAMCWRSKRDVRSIAAVTCGPFSLLPKPGETK